MITEKEEILKRLLAENKITFEEMLILQQKEIQIKYIETKPLEWIQPYKTYIGTPDWTYRPEHSPQWNTITCINGEVTKDLINWSN